MKRSFSRTQQREAAAVAVAAAASLLVACAPQTRHRVLSRFLDGVPPYEQWLHPETAKIPGQSTAELEAARPKVTGPTLREFPREGRPEIEQLRTWEEALPALPKLTVPKAPKIAVDWIAAVDKHVIAPLRSLEKDAPSRESRDTEVPLKGDEGVIFHHATHDRWLACDNCHDAIFPKTAGETEMTMDEMGDGKYCGVCHGKGKIALDLKVCAACHQKEPAKKG
jgi:c(7)-type cytochrome triheme protein